MSAGNVARRVQIGSPEYYEVLGRVASQSFRTLAAVRSAQKRAGGGGEIIDILDSRGKHSGYVVTRNPAGESAFDRCVQAVAARGTARDPRAVCAAAGRRKYGQAEMTRRSVAGRRRAARGNPPLRYFARPGSGGGWDIIDRETGDVGRNVKTKSAARQVLASLNGRWLAGRGSGGLLERGKRGETGKHGGPSQSSFTFNPRMNPAEAAAAVSEEFHGRPVKEMVSVSQRRHYHKYLAELGELRQLVVVTHDGRYRVKMKTFEGALLCANEDKNQLYILGGNQSVKLRDFGIGHEHEIEDLGELHQIDYFTTKEHLGSEGGRAVYWHKFRAPRPSLHFRVRDSTLEISGGRYRITAEGIES